MNVREATPDDADAIERLSEGELDAARLIRDRAVSVAEGADQIEGFVSYDTYDGTVHVSTLVGELDVIEALLAEPRRFAHAEGLPIEIVVPASEEGLERVVREAGFERVGDGPQFEGQATHRFRDSG